MAFLQPLMLAFGGIFVGVGLMVQIFWPDFRMQGFSMPMGLPQSSFFWDEPASSVNSLATFLLGIVSLIVGVIIVVWSRVSQNRKPAVTWPCAAPQRQPLSSVFARDRASGRFFRAGYGRALEGLGLVDWMKTGRGRDESSDLRQAPAGMRHSA